MQGDDKHLEEKGTGGREGVLVKLACISSPSLLVWQKTTAHDIPRSLPSFLPEKGLRKPNLLLLLPFSPSAVRSDRAYAIRHQFAAFSFLHAGPSIPLNRSFSLVSVGRR